MRYRRLLDHVKEQNWFAVLLDFVIVVIGILIAFQITEASNARKEKKELDIALGNVAQEILETVSSSEQHIKFSERVIEKMERVLDMMKTQSTLSEEDLLYISVSLHTQLTPPPINFRTTTLMELQNSGRLKDIQPDTLRFDLKLLLTFKENYSLYRDTYYRDRPLPDIPKNLMSWTYSTPEGFDEPYPHIVDFDLAAARDSQAFNLRLMMIIQRYRDKIREVFPKQNIKITHSE